jgi:hypothetical protein
VVASEGDEIVGSGGQHEVDRGACQRGERYVFKLNDVKLANEG